MALPEWVVSSIAIITGLVMVFSAFGLAIPLFPGGVIIWIAAILYGLVVGLDTWGIVTLILITIVAIVSTLADNVLMGSKAKEAGGSWWGIVLAFTIALIVSLFLTPIAGLFAAPLALYAVELIRLRDHEGAWRVTRGLLAGWGLAFAVRFGLAVLKILLWGGWVWHNLAVAG